ncbi:TetR/AcrR family transcriptional regulator [Chitinimonas sp. BJB300]|uniref:TetR/AcrR family transcriptional regulator n=1 Tax=Chitinimonas sp. BJB300 TaxID=1559339 RepID=UPI000C1068C1|nr:TetR/AcrR family transcriptional regulator [Chitinimonas sp. BJB300]PHV10577.1 TetR family transcriptional regulator [Chitinimonas sp. BJB300]TSJ91051.1 TetR/AcrR family transcriptional regulator [Chitinimonas sp. BJB300]
MQTATTPRKTPRQTRSQATVESILEATARVLAQHGYAATNTNRITELACVSVGSLYQYFPNKLALIAALHERHVAQMAVVLLRDLSTGSRESITKRIRRLIAAVLAAHRLEPDLHWVLERNFVALEPAYDVSPADQLVHGIVRQILDEHRAELGVVDINLASYMVLRMLESLDHATVLEPTPHLATDKLEQAIGDAILGYLTRPARLE